MTLSELKYKLKNKIHYYLITSHRNKQYEKYFSYYCSYRYSLRYKNINKEYINYLAARPNPCAGIGHQMANWIAGYWFAKRFDLKFAHIPFSNAHHPFVPNEWETFLGFGEGEILVSDILHKGYKKVLLPLFDECCQEQIEKIEKIIESYSDRKVVFICEQDQFVKNQYYVMDDLQKRFYFASDRKNDLLFYDKENFNIAIHVRRGDIMKNVETNSNMKIRFLSNEYYIKVLHTILKVIHNNKKIHIYLFSQGSQSDYPEFQNESNMHWCLNMEAKKTFLHFVYADLLITSKSSFSYKPALLNKGIKVCPRNFWHGYPDARDWILCDDEGNISENELEKLN
jgi:hypothetical protein